MTIRLLSWNVNGLRALHRKGFLKWLAQARPDVLCLQETRAREDQLPSTVKHPAGYHTYFASGVKKGYGGVAIYTRVEPKEVSFDLGVEGFDDEGRVLAADYGTFLLFNVYFPNGKASRERLMYKMRFYDVFLKRADQLVAGGRSLVICGDVNTAHKEIDLSRPKENSKVSGFLPEERAWMDELVSHGYVDTFRAFDGAGGKYSWWDLKTRARDRNVGWRIDYFFVSGDLAGRLENAYILKDVTGSDHCPVGIDLSDR